MANVKQVEIVGEMPFGCHDEHSNVCSKEDCDRFLMLLGQLNLPVQGLKIEYGTERRDEKLNRFGGVDIWIPFRIHGTEAASYAFLDNAVKILEAVGCKLTSKQVVEL